MEEHDFKWLRLVINSWGYYSLLSYYYFLGMHRQCIFCFPARKGVFLRLDDSC